ncbi:MAG: N-acetylmuramoyl-L-alanine amidase, partial [Cyanobacteriota bacterium]
RAGARGRPAPPPPPPPPARRPPPPPPPDRGARPGRFFVIRRTVMPSALTEMGFVTGEIDAPRLADPEFRRRLAVAVASGILNYLNGGR